jgi:hypothetical protein
VFIARLQRVSGRDGPADGWRRAIRSATDRSGIDPIEAAQLSLVLHQLGADELAALNVETARADFEHAFAVHAGLDRALGEGWYAHDDGMRAEVLRNRASLAANLATVSIRLDDVEAGRRWFALAEEAVAELGEEAHPGSLAALAYVKAVLAIEERQFEEALALFRTSAETAQRGGVSSFSADANITRAWLLAELGEASFGEYLLALAGQQLEVAAEPFQQERLRMVAGVIAAGGKNADAAFVRHPSKLSQIRRSLLAAQQSGDRAATFEGLAQLADEELERRGGARIDEIFVGLAETVTNDSALQRRLVEFGARFVERCITAGHPMAGLVAGTTVASFSALEGRRALDDALQLLTRTLRMVDQAAPKALVLTPFALIGLRAAAAESERLGRLAHRNRQYDDAEKSFAESAALFQLAGERRQAQSAHILRSDSLVLGNRIEDAERCLKDTQPLVSPTLVPLHALRQRPASIVEQQEFRTQSCWSGTGAHGRHARQRHRRSRPPLQALCRPCDRAAPGPDRRNQSPRSGSGCVHPQGAINRELIVSGPLYHDLYRPSRQRPSRRRVWLRRRCRRADPSPL